jgi:hypothetical protein
MEVLVAASLLTDRISEFVIYIRRPIDHVIRGSAKHTIELFLILLMSSETATMAYIGRQAFGDRWYWPRITNGMSLRSVVFLAHPAEATQPLGVQEVVEPALSPRTAGGTKRNPVRCPKWIVEG